MVNIEAEVMLHRNRNTSHEFQHLHHALIANPAVYYYADGNASDTAMKLYPQKSRQQIKRDKKIRIFTNNSV
jgi:hypothetical protein